MNQNYRFWFWSWATVNRTSIRHEIVGESFQVAGVVMEFQQPVVVVIRDDDVFGVAGHVNDLQIQPTVA